MQEIEQTAAGHLSEPHYLRTVTELGDAQPIVTNQDIYAEGGMKLLTAGSKFDSSVFERLIRHKLMPPLDECLSIENPVTGAGLSEVAHGLLEQDAQLRCILPFMPTLAEISGWLLDVPLNPALAFKLTVMREQRPDLFRHSLYIALLALYLGYRSGLERRQMVDLATSALLHDIGILHVDPVLLDRSHRLSESERRHLYAHPVTAWLVVRSYPACSGEVLKAILQHHERLDGSGYPKGLRGNEIGLFGQIIAVAEIVASRYGADKPQYEALRLETILKLNSRRYGAQLIGFLNIFRADDEAAPPCGEQDYAAIREKLFRLSAVLSGWKSLRQMQPPADGVLFDFVEAFIANLEVGLLDAGVNPHAVERNMLGMEEGTRACFEARVLLEEAEWQLRSVLHTIRRRQAEAELPTDPGVRLAFAEWIEEADELLHPPPEKNGA
ncbi:MAG: HD domain-containing phosphohydrolase [Pseudomonadota bacterium]